MKDNTDLVKTTWQLLDYLKFSGNIIIFSREIEVLTMLEKFLIENKTVIDSKIQETYTREYQVLPLRTHPNMNNKGFSGYVYTAIKVVPTQKLDDNNTANNI